MLALHLVLFGNIWTSVGVVKSENCRLKVEIYDCFCLFGNFWTFAGCGLDATFCHEETPGFSLSHRLFQ